MNSNNDNEAFILQLKNTLKGEVRHDPISRRAYSVDASIYEIEPIAIAIPKNKEDILNAVLIAYEYDIPVTPRGAATGITGGCIGDGLILDLSKHLNRIIQIDYDAETVTVEPGVVQDTLNEALAEKGYRLGPDTSTGNRATIGGMLANNAAGARSLRYGQMVDHVLEVEMILYNGETAVFKELSNDERIEKCLLSTREGRIYRTIDTIREQYREDIETSFPPIPRRVSGYNLDQIIKDGPLNLAKLITGSEGTLGIATEIKLKIVPKQGPAGLCVLHFETMSEALSCVNEILSFHPLALEVIDSHILDAGKQSPSLKNKLHWLKGDPAAILVVEIDDETVEEASKKLHTFAALMQQKDHGYAHPVLLDPKEIAYVWQLRKAGLGLLLSKRSFTRAIAFIEDLSVPPEQIAEFIDKFLKYLKGKNKEAGIYGHAGAGCIHIRPYIDIRSSDDLKTMKQMMLDVTELVQEHSGSLSGEHGDGIIRAWLNRKLYGMEIYRAFMEVKVGFDPQNRMNPGKIVNGQDLLENLRYDPDLPLHEIDTFLDFSKEGGFPLAVDLCNGNAQCRKREGVMCPSFQATGDERDTTRARAQALRGILHGRLPLNQITHEGILEVLDLCLECKGCKKDCPSQVNMAKLKSEMLYQYHETYGYKLRDKLFGNVGKFFKLASPFAKIVNYLSTSFLSRPVRSWMGLTPHRTLPALASQRFSQWVKKQPKSKGRSPVILFNDTYTEFNEPKIGIAAYHVLKALGYEVIVPSWKCCGRPFISKGLLKEARKGAEHLVDQLLCYAEKKIPIVGLEPSCILTMSDDFPDLVTTEDVQSVADACVTFDEFVAQHIEKGQLPLRFKEMQEEVIVHGHCHQKSLVGMEPTMQVLNAIPCFKACEIQSGCCGVAGSFGYEKEHYDISVKIGELKLLPVIRQSPKKTLVIANGISCRSQITHGTDRTPMHLAQIIYQAMDQDNHTL